MATTQPLRSTRYLSDELLLCVFQFCFGHQNETPISILLVNKHFQRLSLPFFLRTIVVRSESSLERLISTQTGSPFLEPALSLHVQYLEILFFPSVSQLSSAYKLNLSKLCLCPNLSRVTFRFDFGVMVPALTPYPHSILRRNLVADTLQHSMWLSPDTLYFAFLSKFNPRVFEWISSDKQANHFVGISGNLRRLFNSWGSLSHVFLDHIFLIDLLDFVTFRICLPGEYVHIRAPIVEPLSKFLSQSGIIVGSRKCQLLTLEMQPDLAGCSRNSLAAVWLPRNTVVSLIGWPPIQSRTFKSGVSGFKGDSKSTMLVTSTPLEPILVRPKSTLLSTARKYIVQCYIVAAIVFCYILQEPRHPLYPLRTLETTTLADGQAFSRNMFDPLREAKSTSILCDQPDTYLTYYQTTSRGSWIVTSSHATYSCETATLASASSKRSAHASQAEPVSYFTYYPTTSHGEWIITSSLTTYSSMTSSAKTRNSAHFPDPTPPPSPVR